jgi:molybdopterin molybdotransferase
MNKGLLSVDEALEQMLAGAHPLGDIEEVPTLEATGRVLARAQRSTMDVPPMDNSAMDGYAVRRDEVSPSRKFRVAQKTMASRSRRAARRASSPGRRSRRAPMPW